ncbi:hypothetical protein PDO_1686 [Rhizobium sp. PDO1-076]|nr:hypothetical protein PDO_1686 [Rhizobium sp. PDO1-076]
MTGKMPSPSRPDRTESRTGCTALRDHEVAPKSNVATTTSVLASGISPHKLGIKGPSRTAGLLAHSCRRKRQRISLTFPGLYGSREKADDS